MITPHHINFWYKGKMITAFICEEYPGYSLTECGRVFSHRKGLPIKKGVRATTINYKEGRELKVQKNPKGYPIIGLSFWGKKLTIAMHSWMALLFYGPRPINKIIRHIDGNILNYHYKNLNYGTHQENSDDKIKHGTMPYGDKACNSKISNQQAMELRSLRKSGKTVKYLQKKFSLSEASINSILGNRTYKSGFKTLVNKTATPTKVIYPSGLETIHSSLRKAAVSVGLDAGSARKVAIGKFSQHKGFKFEYLPDYKNQK